MNFIPCRLLAKLLKNVLRGKMGKYLYRMWQPFVETHSCNIFAIVAINGDYPASPIFLFSLSGDSA